MLFAPKKSQFQKDETKQLYGDSFFPQPAEEVAEALRQFVIRMEDRARSRKMASHTPRRTQEVQEENAFQSSAIKYCLTHTTPFFKK